MITDNKPYFRCSALIRTGIVSFSIILLIFAVMPNFAEDAEPDNHKTAEQNGATQISKAQLRVLLSEILLGEQEQADAEQGDSATTADTEIATQKWNRIFLVGGKLLAIKQILPDYPATVSKAFAKSTNPQSGWSGFYVLTILVATLIAGLMAETFTTRKLLMRLYAYAKNEKKTTALKYKFAIIKMVVQIIGVAVLAVVTYAIVIFFRHSNIYFDLLLTECIAALLMFRLWMILLRNVFSPYRPKLRPIPLDDVSSRQIYHWFIVFFAVIEFGNALLNYLMATGVDEAHINGLLIPYTLVLNLIVISQVWVMRKKIAGMFTDTQDNHQNNFALEFLYSAWPFIFTAWLTSLWMLWIYKAFLGQWDDAQYASISWWITLAFFVADRIFHSLVKNVVNIKWLDSATFAVRSGRFIRIVQNGFRLLMIAVSVYMFSLSLGLSTDSLMNKGIGNTFLAQGINLLVIASIAYIVWEFFNALIERSLPKELDAIAALESDGGGAGATRAETLLPLMRTCLTVTLISFLVLSVLHSSGIAITPLLAGAGVVGIAIGFGAQKLVQDVLSGIFFLVDDAFRKGEYIEIENLRGTVEKISLRSMQLRHHLGAVQTIPYGEIKTVKNISRDWVTMKLELRLSYDADIEQVRKIIKKVGQSMLEDKVLGHAFILPLKSQGVMRVEESALIVRMKFTTKPGEQWVIRREAYRKVRDALSEAGIFFAHREVRVRLPDDQLTQTRPNSEALSEEVLPAAAAAAADSMLAEEAEKKGKMDYENDM